ncbi:hypothetical protein BD414DRAFT_300734 [Trametes punicea]|nr:hypothetical protein BD414DRAFT_300734 [Trametes punicea]
MLRRTLSINLQALCFASRPFRRLYVRKAASHVPLADTEDTFLAAYAASCNHPSLALVHAFQNPALHENVIDALQSAGVDRAEYDVWRPVVVAPTLSCALDAVQHIVASKQSTSSTSSEEETTHSVTPVWTILALLRKLPASQMEVFVVHRLALSLPISASPLLMPLVLLLTARWLAQFRMYSPLRHLVLRIAQSHNELRAAHISLLLRVLAQAESTYDVRSMIILLLQLAKSYHMKLGSVTYRALLSGVTAHSATAVLVESHMRKIGFTPNLSHSRAFVKIYGEGGRRKHAALYWRRIRLGQFYGKVPRYIYKKKYQSMMLEDYLKAFKDTKKSQSYLHYFLKTTTRAQRTHEAQEAVRADSKPMLPSPDHIRPNIWLQVLRTAAKDDRTPTNRLLVLYEQIRESISNRNKRLIAACLVTKSLLRRQHFKAVEPLLMDILHDKDNLDAAQLTIAVEAMTMLGEADAAFRLLQNVLEVDPSGPFSAIIETRTLNSFMIALLRVGRPDAVFYIWDTMPRIFRVEPDSTTFAILLKAARFARKCEGTLQVALEDFGLRRILPLRVMSSEFELAAQNLDRERAIEGLEQLLKPDPKRVVTGFWRGERAGAVALRLAWRVLLGNWPTLATLRSPVSAIRRNASAQALSPVADLFRSVVPPAAGVLDGAVTSSAMSPEDEYGRTYFSIVPHDPLFRALFDLLGEEDRAPLIPLVLTWMRYMQVVPTKDTLATALVYWAEVSLGGPLIERFKGPNRSQYDALLEWITDWVGKQRVPGTEETQKALRRVQFFRDRLILGGAARDKGEQNVQS